MSENAGMGHIAIGLLRKQICCVGKCSDGSYCHRPTNFGIQFYCLGNVYVVVSENVLWLFPVHRTENNCVRFAVYVDENGDFVWPIHSFV